MESAGPLSYKRELSRLTIIVEHIFERGWITEAEWKNFGKKRNLKDKKVEIYDLIKNVNYQHAAKLLCAIRCINEDDETVNGNTNAKEANRNQENAQEILISKYSSLLIDQGLITLEENKLFLSRRMKNKRGRTEKCRRNTLLQNNQNPLKHSPVIRCLFGFLGLYDIKRCRLVSKEWNEVGNLFLRLRGVVKICNFHRLPSKFSDTFASSPPSLKPFPSFRIFGWHQHPWADAQLTNFFDSNQEGIRELHLDHLFLNTNGKKVVTRDITPWVIRSPMIKQKNKYNTKLKINCWDETGSQDPTVMKVPLELLKHIKEISLNLCSVHLKDGVRMSPVNLELKSVKFYQNENFVPHIRINDIIEFSRIKTIKLNLCNLLTRGSTDITLDLDGKEKLNLDNLSLSKVTLLNWSTSNWKVQKLKLYELPFVEKTRMEISEFVYETTIHAEERFDLFALPDSIEKLSINSVGCGTDVICTNRINLPKLKFLYLDIRANPTIISHFRHCPTLTEMVIVGPYSSDVQWQLQTSWIPRSVKILKLTNMTLNWQEGCQLCLEKLILGAKTFGAAKEIITTHIRVDSLVLRCEPKYYSQQVYQVNDLGVCHSIQKDDVAFMDLFQHLNSLNCYQKLYVGPFDWVKKSFIKNSPMARYVIQQSEFYVFENRKGKAIREAEFNKIFKV